jgi:hypothetical protein
MQIPKGISIKKLEPLTTSTTNSEQRPPKDEMRIRFSRFGTSQSYLITIESKSRMSSIIFCGGTGQMNRDVAAKLIN